MTCVQLDVSNLFFILCTQVTTNQAVDLVIIGDELTPVTPFEVSLNHGPNTICLPSQGNYILTPRGCYIFGSKSYSVAVRSDAPTPPMKVMATRAYVDGVIRVHPAPGECWHCLLLYLTMTSN